MSKHELCPFCGSDKLKLEYLSYVECKNCGCYGPSVHRGPYDTRQREIVEAMIWDKWDERHEKPKTKDT